MGSGGGCVDAERLAAVIARLPSDAETVLEFSPAALAIRCGSVRVTLTPVAARRLPRFALRDEKKTGFAMDAGRAGGGAGAGVLGHVERTDTLLFVRRGDGRGRRGRGGAAARCATNGNDLALARMPLPAGAEGIPAIIIPAPAVEDLEKLLKGADVIDLTISETALVAEIGGMVLLTKLISATFPNYDRVLPEAAARKFAVDGPELVRVTRLASLFSKSEKTKPWARMTLSEGRAVVFAGEGNDRVVSELDPAAFEFIGGDIDIVATAFVLLETASRVTGRIALHLVADDAPILILDEGDLEVICVSSPVRG